MGGLVRPWQPWELRQKHHRETTTIKPMKLLRWLIWSNHTFESRDFALRLLLSILVLNNGLNEIFSPFLPIVMKTRGGHSNKNRNNVKAEDVNLRVLMDSLCMLNLPSKF